MKKYLAIFLVLFSISMNIKASIVTLADVGSSGAQLQGLEWLSLDITANIRREEVELGYGGLIADGWRYSSRLETETLLTSLWGGSISGYSASNYAGAAWFLQNFGVLRHIDSTSFDQLTNWNVSGFYFGNDGECDANVNYSCLGQIQTYDNNTENHSGTDTDGNFLMDSYIANSGVAGYLEEARGLNAGINDFNLAWEKNNRDIWLGSMLVREESVASVPAPAAVWLLGSGLIGLIGMRKKAGKLSGK